MKLNWNLFLKANFDKKLFKYDFLNEALETEISKNYE